MHIIYTDLKHKLSQPFALLVYFMALQKLKYLFPKIQNVIFTILDSSHFNITLVKVVESEESLIYLSI